MATKRDLVEAYSFSRRRLVTAFVSGAPGGREVEPTRPGRTIVGGLALAVLLVAGAAIAGVFAPKDPEDWNQPGLVVSKETGAAYVILQAGEHPVLRPVINITSAKLILPDGSEPTLVSQDTIDQQTIGDDIGILGAPASLPTPSLLIDSGWSACTADRAGVRVDVAKAPAVQPKSQGGFVVQSRGAFYVIAESTTQQGTVGAYRYRLPKNADRDNLLGDLGLPISQDAAHVTDDWLALFPTGGDLAFSSFGLTGFGDPVGYPDVPRGARVGDVVAVRGQDESFLLTEEGPARMDDFALTVYRHTTTPTGRLAQGGRVGGSPVETTEDSAPVGDQTKPAYDLEAHWPTGLLEQVPGELCAQLTSAVGEAPAVRLAGDPDESAGSTGLAEGRVEQTVDAGRGAYVLSGDWTDTAQGSPFVIDAKGLSYPLVGKDAAARLGYGEHRAPVVPDSWVKLFRPGVNLSVDDALCRPRSDPEQPCE